MSVSSQKGKTLEYKIASILRSKLGAQVARDKRSGAGINKADMNDYYRQVPLHIEAKNQKTIKIKEFFRQAEQAASVGQAPTVVFNADNEEVLACLRFSDLINFLVEIKDQQKEITMLREPKVVVGIDVAKGKDTVHTAVKTCREGHISDQWGYCLQLNCKYSRTYKTSKKH